MMINRETYVGSKVFSSCSNICNYLNCRLITDLGGNVEYIFFTGVNYDFYIDYKRGESYVFCLNDDIKTNIINKLNDCKNDIDNIITYLRWIKRSQDV